ncbi:subclass B1 metallo-beta-lactamase [Flammeovirga pacifica]|uniref:beta-lactamase n=1 Tax=Flammeovirga pacifica TaxID=915059 RepID=A0A1S1YY65_FLAPC|nr:subclass B1 metallo-beta-lactamase [Flammeovirga pacifica]OHX65825.1 subclass B1 metallo-beta-lactamase [Flammeovirga pacifica]
MKSYTTFFIILILFISCSIDNPKNYQSENLKIIGVSEHVWQHISYLDTEQFGKVACNGMLVIDDGEAILIDTPTGKENTTELYQWLQENDIELKAVIPTHFHKDCLGGLDYLHSKGIESYGSYLTILSASKKHITPPQNAFKDSLTLMVDDHEVEFKYLGKGHTNDNIVAYVPSDKILFGGCLVKSLNAGKGNLEDADTLAWPITLAKVKDTYPTVKKVIPGHGAIGDTKLLDYTIELFSK